jgi:preprotein translocase subunit Sss1
MFEALVGTAVVLFLGLVGYLIYLMRGANKRAG